MPVRLLLMGKAGSGKDTAARYLVERYGFRRYAFADKLKEVARGLWPEEFEGGRKPRRLLQEFGTLVRSFDPLVWVRYVLREVEAGGADRVVVSDGRLLDEYRACREAGFTVVRVDCPPVERARRLVERDGVALCPEEEAHPSEKELDTVPPDFVLDNSGGFEDLYKQIDDLMWRLDVDPVPAAGPASDPTLAGVVRGVEEALARVRSAGPRDLEMAIRELERACHRVRCACNSLTLLGWGS
ncbi:MAG: AAA family ATPase [Moorellaceae bacterium]